MTLPFSNPLRIIESSEAHRRLAEARTWVEAHLARGAVIVSAARGAADELARAVAITRGGTVGLHRFSFSQIAAHLAAPVLAARGIAPATRMGSEAVAARAAFEARKDDALRYFAPVAATPGFPRALARTLHELAFARVDATRLRALPLGGADLAELLERFDEQFVAAAATDRAALLEAASAASSPFADLPLVLLDVPLESAIELAFARQLIASAGATLVTVPFGDLVTLGHLKGLGVEIEVLAPEGTSDLTALRRYLFAARQPPVRERTGEVRLFSAPGENRECIEIARRILAEAQRGVPFDHMAVLVRASAEYAGLLEDAFDRASIPAWFERGGRRPHPAGRALLAIVSCAVERLSAARFAEYLSLGQVPREPEGPDLHALPADETFAGFTHTEVQPPNDVVEPDDLDAADEDLAVVGGTLREPWKWEKLIVESAVIGVDSARWRRRLDGLRAHYDQKLREERSEDPESPKVAGLERDRRNLIHLTHFALPIIDTLASWPREATWSEWLAHFRALAPRILRYHDRVTRVLDELRPMGAIGPVTLEEVRDVLAERLRTLDDPPPATRYGKVFVGTPQQARGRAFQVVFVPALAERLFPRKPREDPLLLDEEMRAPLAAGLPIQEDRLTQERLLLRLAVGAATERLWLSYPRLEVSSARPRVPSFYVLDVMRAVTGRIPNHELLQQEAAAAGKARLDWPAPPAPADAIDELEHDLATLGELIGVSDQASVRGHAHYMLDSNDALRRSVTRRWARAQSRWRAQDGLVQATAPVRPMLATQRLGARSYSVSALQKFKVCPYQFTLSAIYRLAPNEEPEPLQRLDPLMKGSIFHEVQAKFFRVMKAEGKIPVTIDHLPAALSAIDTIVAEVAQAQAERLAPAIERVWTDEIAAIRRDLRVWVRKLPDNTEWTPEYFEYAFGLTDATAEGRDERSVSSPVRVDGRFQLRGSVDLIEVHAHTGALRITDHKTGRNRTTPRTVIGGGATLQPVVYGLAVELLLGRPVSSGRLFYCTAPGGFAEHHVALTEANRRAALEALEVIDRAIELGFLPPAPEERACEWCDFRPVCGPDEPQHVRRKPADSLADLTALRGMP